MHFGRRVDFGSLRVRRATSPRTRSCSGHAHEIAAILAASPFPSDRKGYRSHHTRSFSTDTEAAFSAELVTAVRTEIGMGFVPISIFWRAMNSNLIPGAALRAVLFEGARNFVWIVAHCALHHSKQLNRLIEKLHAVRTLLRVGHVRARDPHSFAKGSTPLPACPFSKPHPQQKHGSFRPMSGTTKPARVDEVLRSDSPPRHLYRDRSCAVSVEASSSTGASSGPAAPVIVVSSHSIGSGLRVIAWASTSSMRETGTISSPLLMLSAISTRSPAFSSGMGTVFDALARGREQLLLETGDPPHARRAT